VDLPRHPLNEQLYQHVRITPLPVYKTSNLPK